MFFNFYFWFNHVIIKFPSYAHLRYKNKLWITFVCQNDQHPGGNQEKELDERRITCIIKRIRVVISKVILLIGSVLAVLFNKV